MNVLWVTPGGLEPRIGATIPALEQLLRAIGRRHSLHAITLEEERGARDYWIDEVRVSAVGRLFMNQTARLSAAWLEMGRLHRAHRFDRVHGFWGTRAGFLAASWGRAHGVPSIVSYFGGEPVAFTGLEYGGWRTPQSRALLRLTARAADRLTAGSPYLIRRFEAVGMRGPWTRWSVGIDQAPFRAAAASRPVRARPPEAPVILGVSDWGAIKDHRTLLETVAELRRRRPIRLRLAGDQRGEPVRTWLQELGLEDITELLGRVPHDRLPEVYRDADLLLHTARHEGQGLVFLEAAAAECPIVSTPVGLAEEMGASGAAELAPVGDPMGIAAAAERVLDQAQLRWDRISNARRYAAEFDLEQVVRTLEALYDAPSAS